MLVVSGLGSTTYDAGAAGDRPLNFYLWGAMGGAAMIGLGLALAQPARRVLVLTGDGEMLMGLGSLATIAAQAPDNLAIAVFDNGSFGETGAQPSHTALGADLAGIARGCGWPVVETVTEMSELAVLRSRLRRERLFAVVRIRRRRSPASCRRATALCSHGDFVLPCSAPRITRDANRWCQGVAPIRASRGRGRFPALPPDPPGAPCGDVERAPPARGVGRRQRRRRRWRRP